MEGAQEGFMAGPGEAHITPAGCPLAGVQAHPEKQGRLLGSVVMVHTRMSTLWKEFESNRGHAWT